MAQHTAAASAKIKTTLGSSGFELREGATRLVYTIRGDTPARENLLVVRTGASVVEMKVPAIAREPSQSNLSDGLSPSRHPKHTGSVNDLPIRIPNLDLAQIQLLYVLFDLCAVAYGKNDHLVRQNVFLRHRLRLRDCHRINAIRQRRKIIQRKIVSEKFSKRPRRLRSPLEPPRQRARNRILRKK